MSYTVIDLLIGALKLCIESPRKIAQGFMNFEVRFLTLLISVGTSNFPRVANRPISHIFQKNSEQ